jgi:hypothetical protein
VLSQRISINSAEEEDADNPEVVLTWEALYSQQQENSYCQEISQDKRAGKMVNFILRENVVHNRSM